MLHSEVMSSSALMSQQYIKLIDDLKVAAFPVMNFKTESMGGYVAENHRAYMQLAPWIFRWVNEYKDSRKKLDSGTN